MEKGKILGGGGAPGAPPQHPPLLHIFASINSKPSLVQIMQWFVASSAPTHCQNQSWLFINWTHGNKFQWNLNLNFIIFIQQNAFENAGRKMATICLGRNALMNAAPNICWVIWFMWLPSWHNNGCQCFTNVYHPGFAAVVLEQSPILYDCPNGSEATLKNMG